MFMTWTAQTERLSRVAVSGKSASIGHAHVFLLFEHVKGELWDGGWLLGGRFDEETSLATIIVLLSASI